MGELFQTHRDLLFGGAFGDKTKGVKRNYRWVFRTVSVCKEKMWARMRNGHHIPGCD